MTSRINRFSNSVLRTTAAYLYVLATYGTETPFKIHTPTKVTPEVSRRVTSDKSANVLRSQPRHRPNFQIAEIQTIRSRSFAFCDRAPGSPRPLVFDSDSAGLSFCDAESLLCLTPEPGALHWGR
jgi:hypothetical protein